MVICQPRIGGRPPSFVDGAAGAGRVGRQAWRTPAAASWPAHLLRNSDRSTTVGHCRPHEDACRFCKAKGTARRWPPRCSPRWARVHRPDHRRRARARERSSSSWWPRPTPPATWARRWTRCRWSRCGARRSARGARSSCSPAAVAGYKLVAGKKGARAWADEAEAEKLLKAMRLKKEQMYDLKLISPTSAEKLLKAQPKRWTKAAALIKQATASPPWRRCPTSARRWRSSRSSPSSPPSPKARRTWCERPHPPMDDAPPFLRAVKPCDQLPPARATCLLASDASHRPAIEE
jgi:hypothetical protein